MKRILILTILIFGFGAKAQTDSVIKPAQASQKDSLVEYFNKNSNSIVDAIIVDGDTIPILVLDEVLFIENPTFDSDEARRRYYLLRRKVFKVYPYAVIAGNKLDSLNLVLASISSKRKKKRFIKDFQEYLEGKFEDRLRKLTRTEGQILSKLIYRETGITTYELISEYRSGWNAFWWNVAANYYDISLKTPYDPEIEEEDRLIENILLRAFSRGTLTERVPITEL